MRLTRRERRGGVEEFEGMRIEDRMLASNWTKPLVVG